jgi:hypothetical protein
MWGISVAESISNFEEVVFALEGTLSFYYTNLMAGQYALGWILPSREWLSWERIAGEREPFNVHRRVEQSMEAAGRAYLFASLVEIHTIASSLLILLQLEIICRQTKGL